MPPQSHLQPPSPPSPPAPGAGLNVIALISGGKDSLYSLLHCIRNGHRVVALANLHPAANAQPANTTSTDASPVSSSTPLQHVPEEEEQDLDSFMYQTIGHSIIPLYETALGIPLYRQPIRGGAVDTSRIYRLQAEDQMADSPGRQDSNNSNNNNNNNNNNNTNNAEEQEDQEEADETESLIPLLKRIMQAHPEANAVSAGAILSTYQRTRIENVAARLGLVPLAWLWQYPVLPDRRATEAGLLEDMAAAGCEARIIKVASGGLDEGFLWGDVAAADGRVRGRIVKGMRRFADAEDIRGAVLGEGGEYESLALDGPAWLWRCRIEVAGWEACVGDGGVGFVRLKGARCVGKDGEGDGEGDRGGPESVRRPDLLDEGFEEVLGSVLGAEGALAATGDEEEERSLLDVGSRGWSDGLDPVQTTDGRTWVIANVTAPEAGSGAGEQMKAIAEKIQTILRSSSSREVPRTTADIVFTTVLLRSMSDFPLMNSIYVSMFKKPNPPARATVACGASLPEGVSIMVSAVVDLGSREQRQGLHVQSRSYWAPANIGPYSQAMSVPLQGPEQLVYIAGQIPLEPASMEIYGLEETWFKGFSSRAVLSLQHLWRIGVATNINWWLGAVAFLTGADHIRERAKIAWNLWETMHHNQEEEEDADDESGLDAWDLKYGGRAHEQVKGVSKPGLPRFDVVQSEGSMIPAFFAVQIEELPRGSDIEWQGLGFRCDKLKITTEELEYGRQTVVTTGQDLGYIGIEVDAKWSGPDFESCLRSILQNSTQGSKSPHVVIYTTQPLSNDPSWGQIVPCKSAWGSKGRQLAAGVIVQRQKPSA